MKPKRSLIKLLLGSIIAWIIVKYAAPEGVDPVPLLGAIHLNLTPLIGILAGPVLGGLVVFVVNVLSAAIGHGGWGLIGANVLVNVTEVITAWLAFRALGRATGSLFARAGLATLGGLFAGNLVQWIAPLQGNDYPGAVRLAEIAAYPMLLALPQRYTAFGATLLPASPPTSSEKRPCRADRQTLQAFYDLAQENSRDKVGPELARQFTRLMPAHNDATSTTSKVRQGCWLS